MSANAFKRLRWALALGWVLALLACDDSSTDVQPQEWASEPLEYKVGVANQTRFFVVGINGAIEIVGAAQLDSFVVAGERRVGSSSVEDAEQYLDSLQVLVDDNDQELLIRTVHPTSPGSRSFVVDYDLRVPEAIEARVYNTNGSITARGFLHRLIVATTNGNVELEDMQADIAARTTNGNIVADVTLDPGGVVNSVTTNGNISLRIPASTSAQLTAAVINGRVDVSGLSLQDVTSTSTSLDGRLGEGEGTIYLRTTNGTITITGY